MTESPSSSSSRTASNDLAIADIALVDGTDPMTAFAANSAALELSGEENACYSPAAYYMALAMVAAGASGEAQQQLFHALGVKSTDGLVKYCQAQLGEIRTFTEESTIDIADSLWSNVGYTFQAEYQDAVNNYFDAGAFDVEFGTQQTNDLVTKWISDETRGLVAPAITLDAKETATLISTIYFKDLWAQPFNEEDTAENTFYAKDGESNADYMHITTNYGAYIAGDGFTAARMPFSGGSTCTFYLPNEDSNLTQLFKDPRAIAGLISAEPDSNAQIKWSIPRFKTSSTFGNLVDCAKQLGVTDVFDPALENMFRNMIVASNESDMHFHINDIIQETTISLNEFGAEAAAYTMTTTTGAASDSEPTETVEFMLDRPFAYIITAPNNVPLFIGVVANPSA